MLHVVMAWDELGSIWPMGWWPRCWLCHNFVSSFEWFLLRSSLHWSVFCVSVVGWLGRVGPQIGPSGARTPLPLIPCQLQNPFLISFFPPTPIITPPHLDQKVTFLPFLEPTGYSVTIKVYHDAITVTLSRLMDNWSTIVQIIIIFSLTVRSLIRYSAHQRGFGIGLYWRED